jgi:hypothetical protein
MGRIKDLYTEMHEAAEEQGGIPEELKDMLRRRPPPSRRYCQPKARARRFNPA